MAAPRHPVRVGPRFPVRVNMADPYNGAPDNIVLAWNLFQPDPIIGPDAVFSVASANYDEAGNNIGLNPRIDAGKGLWMGPAITNLLTNSECSGVSVGAAPTGWTTHGASSSGVFVYVVGGGQGYVDYRVVGTASANSYRVIEPGGGRPSAVVGESFTASADIEILNGSLAIGGYMRVGVSGLNSVPAQTQSSQTANIIASGKYQITRELTDATTAYARFYIEIFTPSGLSVDIVIRIKRPQFEKSKYKGPYVPTTNGAVTQPTNAATTGGNGTNIPLDAGLMKCFGNGVVPAVCTTMAEHYMGVGSGDIAIGYSSVIDVRGATGGQYSMLFFGKSADGTGVISQAGDGSAYIQAQNLTWSANEIHRRYVQTSSDGTKFRVGYQRFSSAMVEITAGIKWSHTGAESTWVTFDGSFNPLTYLRMCLNVTVPIWGRKIVIANKSLSAAEISDAWGLVA